MMRNWDLAEGMGYAESKSIAGRLLAAAGEKSGLDQLLRAGPGTNTSGYLL